MTVNRERSKSKKLILNFTLLTLMPTWLTPRFGRIIDPCQIVRSLGVNDSFKPKNIEDWNIGVDGDRRGLQESKYLNNISAYEVVVIVALFSAERRQSLGFDWHPWCLKCEECGKVLQPGQHAEVRNPCRYVRCWIYCSVPGFVTSQYSQIRLMVPWFCTTTV